MVTPGTRYTAIKSKQIGLFLLFHNVKTLYQADSKDILRHLGLNLSGFNYKRIIQTFKALNEKMAIYCKLQC